MHFYHLEKLSSLEELTKSVKNLNKNDLTKNCDDVLVTLPIVI